MKIHSTSGVLQAVGLAACLAMAGVATAQPAAKPQPTQEVKPQPGLTTGRTAPAGQPAAPATSKVAPVPQPTEPAPLKFTDENFDFGKISDTAPVTHEFAFENISGKRIVIKAANAGCGCTTPKFKDDKKVFEAGESGTISVTFDPKGRKGAQPKNVTVMFEDTAYPNQVINFSANVVPLVFLDPSKVHFTEVMKATGAVQTIHVIGRKEGFKVTGVEGANEILSVRLLEPIAGEDNGDPVTKYPLEVTLAKDAPVGNHNTTLIIRTNDEKSPEARVMALAQVVGELKANPPGFIVRVTDPAKPFTTEVQLETRSHIPFEIASVEVDSKQDLALVADYEATTVNGNPGYIIRVSGVTPAAPGAMNGSVIIKSSIEGEELTVNLFGAVRNPNAAAKPGVPVTTSPSGKKIELTPSLPPGVTPQNTTDTPMGPAKQSPTKDATSKTEPAKQAPATTKETPAKEAPAKK
ncbi:MAG: DUF1573 domain-containing protein [Phycisphaerales bacterium]|nr:DUF1573 domain-containing protein [Phycisphaerales bacterium]